MFWYRMGTGPLATIALISLSIYHYINQRVQHACRGPAIKRVMFVYPQWWYLVRRTTDMTVFSTSLVRVLASCIHCTNKQRVLMHGHQGWNVRHGLCHIYMRYVYIYIWVVYSLCFFCCLFITVTWWYVWCFEWASGNQEEVQACLVTLWQFIISCYSLYKTTLGLLCSWFENNPHFHKYSMDFHV